MLCSLDGCRKACVFSYSADLISHSLRSRPYNLSTDQRNGKGLTVDPEGALLNLKRNYNSLAALWLSRYRKSKAIQTFGNVR